MAILKSKINIYNEKSKKNKEEMLSKLEILVNNKKNIDASPIKKSESKKDTSKSPIRGNNNSSNFIIFYFIYKLR